MLFRSDHFPHSGKSRQSFCGAVGPVGYFGVVPFLFLPVLDSNLYPLRMSIYGMLELLLMVLLFSKWKKRTEQSIENNWLGLIILAAFVTVIRTEAIYYFVFFPLLLILLFLKDCTRKKRIQIVVAYLGISLCLYLPQAVGDRLTSGDNYDLTSVLKPIFKLIEVANVEGMDPELQEQIDQVLAMDVVNRCIDEGKNGINAFWGEPDLLRDFTPKEYQAFKTAYYQLIRKYPTVFLKDRMTSFIGSTGLLGQTTQLYQAEGVGNYERFKQYPQIGRAHV